MNSGLLTAYWIESPNRGGPLGFGVTAHSIDDALGIIRFFGYTNYLPADLASLKIIEGVRYHDLEANHIRPNMGPIVVRGMWYPFVRLGM